MVRIGQKQWKISQCIEFGHPVCGNGSQMGGSWLIAKGYRCQRKEYKITKDGLDDLTNFHNFDFMYTPLISCICKVVVSQIQMRAQIIERRFLAQQKCVEHESADPYQSVENSQIPNAE